MNISTFLLTLNIKSDVFMFPALFNFLFNYLSLISHSLPLSLFSFLLPFLYNLFTNISYYFILNVYMISKILKRLNGKE